MSVRLGCIADDFTGATDLANNLVRAGMRVVQLIDVPAEGTDPTADPAADADAVVIALKSRTVPAAQAVEASLRALEWLRAAGAEQIYFKYCSTFDSTPAGNIGQVTEALMDALGTDFTVATPAFPDNGRTVFKGHLFVGDALLSESGMRHHPLTPMTDSNLVSVLDAQTTRPTGLIDHEVVAQGADAVRARIAQLRAQGVGAAIVDAVSNDDLVRLGAAVKELALVTAGSGLAIGLPANWGFEPSSAAAQLPPACGRQAVVAGSVSAATNGQVREFLSTGRPAFSVDPLRIAAGGASPPRRSPSPTSTSPTGPCSSTRPSRRTRSARCRGSSAPPRRASWWSKRSPASPRGSSSAAYGNSWSRAARPPAPSCRRSASRACASEGRSTPGCRGARRRCPAATPSTSRSSRATSAARTSSPQPSPS